jgi:hypothetical protein
MTRRGLMLLMLPKRDAGQKLYEDTIAFEEAHNAWINRLNKVGPIKQGTMDAQVLELWEPLPKMWRQVERSWKEWLMEIR